MNEIAVPCGYRESEPVLIAECFCGYVLSPCGGVYVIRDPAGVIVYVGYTSKPLLVRLHQHRRQQSAWFRAYNDDVDGWADWTITLQDGDKSDELALIWLHRPKFNQTDSADRTHAALARFMDLVAENQPCQN